MSKCVSFTLVLAAAMTFFTPDANSQTRRQTQRNSTSSADGLLHVNIGEEEIGRGYTILPYSATFKDFKNTANGQVIVEYNCNIDWPNYFDAVYSDRLSKVKEAVVNMVIKSEDDYLMDVVAGIDMTSNLPGWLERRVSSFQYETDSNRLYNGPLKNDLCISVVIDNGSITVVSKEIVTDLKNNSVTYESKETF